MPEANFDGIVGPTHNYAGLSPGNVASTSNRGLKSRPRDAALQGLAKAAVFAILVSAIGCLAGLRTGQGPGAVGLSTTRAVVAGIVAIIVADSVLGAFFYALDI